MHRTIITKDDEVINIKQNVFDVLFNAGMRGKLLADTKFGWAGNRIIIPTWNIKYVLIKTGKPLSEALK